MPESVTNRPAKALEYVFLLTKKMGYYFDMEAIKPKTDGRWNENGFRSNSVSGDWVNNNSYINDARGADGSGLPKTEGDSTTRNFRNADLWFQSVDGPHGMTGIGDEIVGLDVTSQSYSGAHFATFGLKLIEPMILAGTSAGGCCAQCGAPYRRVTEQTKLTRERPNDYVKRVPSGLTGGAYSPPGQTPHSNARGPKDVGNTCANSVAGVSVKTLGWEPQCECFGKLAKESVEVTKRVYRPEVVDVGVRNVDDSRGDKTRKIDGKSYNNRPEETVIETRMVYISDLPLEDHPKKPCVVLDPFIGSGTSCCVALAHGRHSIGIDLSEKYLKNNAIPRIEGELLARAALAHLVPNNQPPSTLHRKGVSALSKRE